MTNKNDPAGQKGKRMSDGSSAGPTPLPVEIQGKIGSELKQVYSRMLAEPMPDKFAKLLESLGKTESKE